MLVVVLGQGIDTAEKRPAHAPRHAMIDTDHAGRHDVRACVGGNGRSLQRVLKMSGNSIRNNTSGQVYQFRTALVNDVLVKNVASSSKMSRAVLRSIGIHAARGQDGGCLGLWSAARTVGVLVCGLVGVLVCLTHPLKPPPALR